MLSVTPAINLFSQHHSSVVVKQMRKNGAIASTFHGCIIQELLIKDSRESQVGKWGLTPSLSQHWTY